ncbi:hypothetical protein E3U43_018283 [Larimichthys crocea]|uniref:Uncharacterized protein n=1 Tax=Larimichthys crocea TaxID=215358 RepID=A0ACD3R3A7_LARCR|nr:hypothetical protein E3U43_018283 [Larimichthys crocea]
MGFNHRVLLLLIKTQLSINNSTQILGNPLSVETELRPVLSEQRSDKTPEAPEERSGERSEESESEESFIEVSEEEFKEEDEDDSLVMIRDEGSPDKLHKEEEESSSEDPSSPDAASTLEEDKDKGRQTEEKELKEGAQTESSSTPAN